MCRNVVGTSEFRVNAFVDDPYVRMQGIPAGGGHGDDEKEIDQTEERDWVNSCSVRMEFAAWRASIRWIRRRSMRSAWRWARMRRRDQANPEILIGADTRESSPWIAEQVAGGLESRGVRVRYRRRHHDPGVAYLTRTGPFVAGVMISASHNPYQDNGIKVFGHSGFKLPDEEEHAIEQEIFRIREAGAEPRSATTDGG